MVAAIRANNVDVPLFVHVLGAVLLMGALLVCATALVAAWRREGGSDVRALNRLGLWTLLAGVVPAYVVMRIGAQWVEVEEFDDDVTFTWLDIGYVVADLGGLLTLISIVLAIIGLRKLRGDADRTALARVVAVAALLLLVAYAVAVWAMTAKPD